MRCVALILVVLLGLGASPEAAREGAPEFELSRSAIGGAAAASTGGEFELSATIGQPTAGVSSGGSFAVTSGFWFELTAGDCDDDGVVSRWDYAALRECLSGPHVSPPIPTCTCQDADATNTVDLADFAVFQRSYTSR